MQNKKQTTINGSYILIETWIYKHITKTIFHFHQKFVPLPLEKEGKLTYDWGTGEKGRWEFQIRDPRSRIMDVNCKSA